jgi:protoheme IX farnesyltransferase
MTAGTLLDASVSEATRAHAGGLVGPRPRTSVLRDYVALTKPRIIVLLEVTALCSMVMAARGWPSWRALLATLVGGALAAGGANAVNMWFDRDIDAAMARTCSRPLPAGRIAPRRALAFGVGLGVSAFAVLAVGANLVAALLAIAAYLFYVLVYRTSSSAVPQGLSPRSSGSPPSTAASA